MCTYSLVIGYPIFAWKGQTEEDFWWCIDQCLEVDYTYSNMYIQCMRFSMCIYMYIVCTVCTCMSALYCMYCAPKAIHSSTYDCVLHGLWPLQSSGWQPTMILDDGGDATQRFLTKFPGAAKHMRGVVEESVTGIHRLYQLSKENHLPMSAINVHDSVVKVTYVCVRCC